MRLDDVKRWEKKGRENNKTKKKRRDFQDFGEHIFYVGSLNMSRIFLKSHCVLWSLRRRNNFTLAINLFSSCFTSLSLPKVCFSSIFLCAEYNDVRCWSWSSKHTKQNFFLLLFLCEKIKSWNFFLRSFQYHMQLECDDDLNI
jgi:hypothetical protein